jgi:CDP-diacylglycerol--serine O-phosphatidyltransferase
LPNLFTLSCVLSGFTSLSLSASGRSEADLYLAALAICFGFFFDTFDGRVARLTKTQSDLGRELDSLADVITFGAAPGMLAYLWGLRQLNEDAWLISVFYMVCTATRLARFNVQTRVVDSRYFVGLPSPWAALTICALLSFAPEYKEYPADVRVVMQVVMAMALLLIGALMVSTFRYNSFKKLDLRKRWSYRAFVPFAAILLVLLFIPRAILLVITLLYTLSGPVGAAFARLRPRRGPRLDDTASHTEGAP